MGGSSNIAIKHSKAIKARTYFQTGITEPIHPIELWNMNERAMHDLPKTNNHVEGWHRRLLSAVNDTITLSLD